MENALNGLDLAQSWSYFADKRVELTESFKERDEGKKNNPYVTRSRREAIKKNKHAKWPKNKHCKTTANYGVYKKARNLVISELRKGKYLYEKDLAAEIKHIISSSGDMFDQKVKRYQQLAN